MAFKVFLDANIPLDLTLKRTHYDVAKKIFELAADGTVQLFITPAIVHIVAYWLTRAYGKQKAKELILALLTDVRVIDANHEVVVNAVYSKMDDIEDALQYFTAVHHKLEYFLTRDKLLKKMGMPSLPVYTPEEFLKEMGIILL
jgi:predicted nucleic acid-binding protein